MSSISPAGSARSTSAGPAPAPLKVEISCGALTHPGKVRQNNEDHFLVARLAKSMQICQSSLDDRRARPNFSEEDGYLMVVADGMGGAAAGERASALAVASVKDYALNTLKWFLHVGRKDESALLAELQQEPGASPTGRSSRRARPTPGSTGWAPP